MCHSSQTTEVLEAQKGLWDSRELLGRMSAVLLVGTKVVNEVKRRKSVVCKKQCPPHTVTKKKKISVGVSEAQ